MKQRMAVGIGIAVAGLALAAGVSGQPQGRPGTIDDLLVEVRGLRAELRTAAAANVRAQALVARATLQEQRLRAVSDELNRTQRELTEAARTRADMERAVSEFTDRPVVGNPINREAEHADLQRELKRRRDIENELRRQVTDWSGVVNQEQVRWEDLNRRMDALERQP